MLFRSAISASLYPEFPIEGYKDADMADKILLLKDHLPPFLFEHRAMYKVLSKGIHKLTEEECLNYFPAIKLGIEQILDEKIEAKEKEAKAANANQVMQQVYQQTAGTK